MSTTQEDLNVECGAGIAGGCGACEKCDPDWWNALDLTCGMIEVDGDIDITCGKPARRRIRGIGDGCCDECFDLMLRSFTREELDKQYPLIATEHP